MDIELLQRNFKRMGARIHVSELAGDRGGRPGIDIRSDAKGEYFEIKLEKSSTVAYEVVDLQPKLRHLLLLARRESDKEKYLCGHDERHWFVCGVPDRQGLTGVVGAMEALQPVEVHRAAAQRILRAKERLRRHNPAFIRQGEWFFIPRPQLVVDEGHVLRHEPISRGGGSKPHICQFLFRHGGETVMVCSRYPNGLTMAQYHALLKGQPQASKWSWQAMQRNPAAYARGRISHPDHQTIVLDVWHHILMNTEREAPGSRNVVFLD